mgnify:CR=1 FL=1
MQKEGGFVASKQLGSLLYRIKSKNSDFKRGMRENRQEIRKTDKQMKKSQGVISKYSEGFKKAGMALTAFGAIVTGVSFKLAKMASDANEIQSRFNHVFGEMSKDANEWAESFAKDFGQSRSEVKSMMATLQDTLVPMGVAEEKAFELNKTITQLAIDMSSFANVPLQQAMNDIQSAIVGQSRPMRKYGSVLTQTRVKQYALAEGIVETDRELTEQEKILARVSLMQEDMTKATGDYKRTQDSFANQLRETRNQLKNLGESIGANVLPVFQDLLGHVKDLVGWFDDLPDKTQAVISKFMVWSGIISAIVGPLALLVSFLPQIASGLAMISGAAGPFMAGAAIVGGIVALKNAFSDLNEKQEENLDNTKSLVNEYENLASKENLSTQEKRDLRDISQDLADLYPESVEGINDETDAYIINTEEIRKNAQVRSLQAMSKNIQDNIDDIKEQRKELKKENEELERLAEGSKELQQVRKEAQGKAREVIYQAGFENMLSEDMTLDDYLQIGQNSEFQKRLEEMPKDFQLMWKEALNTLKQDFENTVDLEEEMKNNEEKIASFNNELEVAQKRATLLDKRLSGAISQKEFEKRMEALRESSSKTKDSDSETPGWLDVEDNGSSDSEEETGRSSEDIAWEVMKKGYEQKIDELEGMEKELLQARLNEKVEKRGVESKLLLQAIEEEYQAKREQIRQKYADKREAEKEREAERVANIEKNLTDEIKQSKMSQYEYEKWQLEQQRKKYKDMGVDKKKLEEWYNEQLYQIEVDHLNNLIGEHDNYKEEVKDNEAEIMQWKYQTEQISLERYKEYLRKRLKNLKEDSKEYREVYRKLYNLPSEGGGDVKLNGLKKVFNNVGYSVEEAQSKFQSFRNEMVNGFMDLIDGAKSFDEAIKGIIDSLARMIVKRSIVEPFVDKILTGGSSGGDSNANTAASLIDFITSLGSAHSGGLVTANGIESFHNGGMIGSGPLKPNEKLIKGKVGEVILNQDQQKQVAESQQPNQPIIIQATDAKSFTDRLRENNREIINAAGRNILENGALKNIIKDLR